MNAGAWVTVTVSVWVRVRSDPVVRRQAQRIAAAGGRRAGQRRGAVAVVGERHARRHRAGLGDRRRRIAGGGHRERARGADREGRRVGAGDRRRPVDRDGRGGGAVVQRGQHMARAAGVLRVVASSMAEPELRFADAAARVAPARQRIGEAHRQAGEGVQVGTRRSRQPSESWVSAAVIVEVAFGPTTVAGLAVAVSTSRGETVGAPATLSQPAVPGPVLQPHQLSVASTEPDSSDTRLAAGAGVAGEPVVVQVDRRAADVDGAAGRAGPAGHRVPGEGRLGDVQDAGRGPDRAADRGAGAAAGDGVADEPRVADVEGRRIRCRRVDLRLERTTDLDGRRADAVAAERRPADRQALAAAPSPRRGTTPRSPGRRSWCCC